ncbi:MAG TPA: FAD:protein FMN transferase [Candidatus Dormibacteraeota bacterium]|nr:FAD:protein FMN transferase [Candidatus Dormibacteraeota bacterium]
MAFLVAPVMGTTVSIDVRDRAVGRDVLEAAVAVLRADEARFTTYRPDSEIRRLERGELTLQAAHPDVREVLHACDVLRAESDGAFDGRREGRLDPSGYVKGWSAERAADVLRAAGAASFLLNIGGDIVCAGEPAPGQPWRVGVRDPEDGGRISLVVGVRDGSVATSGLYERGAHIADARTGQVPAAWRSITVLAPDLATADAIATAALAMGVTGPAWAASRFGCEVAAIDEAGVLWTSPGMEAARLA